MRVELPESFEKRMQEMLGDEYESYIESYDNPRQYGLRINPMKITEEELAEGSGFSLDPIPWTKTGIFIKKKISRPDIHITVLVFIICRSQAPDSGGEVSGGTGGESSGSVCRAGRKGTALGAALQGKVCWWQMISVIPGLKHC